MTKDEEIEWLKGEVAKWQKVSTDDDVVVGDLAEQVAVRRDGFNDLVFVVRKMREAQRAYFRNRSRSDLYESKRLEGEVDRLIGGKDG